MNKSGLDSIAEQRFATTDSDELDEARSLSEWFNLLRRCNAMAIQMNVPIVRIPALHDACIDLLVLDGAVELAADAANFGRNPETASIPNGGEKALTRHHSVSIEELISRAHDAGLFRIQIDPDEHFLPRSYPEELYLQYAGVFLKLTRLAPRFDGRAEGAGARKGAVSERLGDFDLTHHLERARIGSRAMVDWSMGWEEWAAAAPLEPRK
jgi:hypothetical protein